MADEQREHIIRPVGYETSLNRVRDAFTKGCGGVIVDGVVPESVLAEAPRVMSLSTAFHMVCRDGNAQPVWKDSCEDWTLPETGRWLADEIRQVAAAGLGWAYAATEETLQLMTVWTNDGVQTQWHIDNQKEGFLTRPDMHLHIAGEGLVVASPSGEETMTMVQSGPSYVWEGKGGIRTPDQILQERGFTLIHLQPGQKLFFRDQCLHRSADSLPGATKMRAGMF